MAASDTKDMESLVALSRDGDRAALDALIYEIQPSIHKLAQRFLMIPADAEDATQEILLKIITRLGQFEGKSQFKTWGKNNGVLGQPGHCELISFTGIAIWAVRDGKLARCWVERAAWELYQKLRGKE